MNSIRLLVAEGEPAAAEDLERRLAGLGHTVVGRAENEAAAIERAGELNPDAVLIDAHLSRERGGFAAAVEIRGRHDVPVIVLIACADAATLQEVRQSEVVAYALKPFEDRELRVVVEMALAKHAADRQLRLARARLQAVENLPAIAAAEGAAAVQGTLTALRQLTGSAQAAYGIVSPDRPSIEVSFTSTEAPLPPPSESIPLAESNCWSEAIRRRAPLIVNDAEEAVALLGAPGAGRRGKERFLAVPLSEGDRVVAVAMAAGRGWDYTGEDALAVADFWSGLQSARERVNEITQRKQAERTLRQWADAFENCAHGIALGLPETNRVLTCNPAFARMLGRSVPEVVGVPIFSLYAPEDAERIRAWIAEADRAGQVRYETRMVRVDGSKFPVQMDTVSVRDTDGRPIYRVATAQDITERKRAENEFRGRLELQDQMAKVAASVPGLICSFRMRPDGTACMPFATPMIVDLYGVRPEDVKDDFSPVLARIHPEDQEHLRLGIAESAREMTPWHDAFRVRHPRRGEVWIEGHSVPRREPDGSILWHGFVQDITERKRAEELLAADATRRRILIDGSRDGIVILDADGKVFEANRRFAESLGYDAGEIRELHVWDWDRDWSRERAMEAIRMLGPEGAHFETRHWRKDGSCFDVELSNSAAELGGRKMVFCVCHDITERKRAEAALRESETELRAMFEGASVGMAESDPRTGRFLRVNRRLCAITGYSEEELLARRIWEITHPDDRERDWELFQTAVRGDFPEYRLEKRYLRKSGTITWVNVNMTVIRDAGGRPLRTMATIEDITERKQAVEALEEREEIFSSIVSQATDAITVVDGATGRFVEFNAAAHEGLGYTREEFAGLSIGDIRAEHSAEDFRRNLARIREQGGIGFDSKHRCRDGGPRDVRVRVRLLHIPGRDYMVAVWTDVTGHKRAEARAARDALRTEFLLELHQRAPQLTDRELYDHVLERAVTLTGSAIGFFHQVSEDQRTIILTTWNSEALKSCTAAFDTHYPLGEAGNWVDCVRQQRPVIYNDYARSPHQRGLPEGHAPVRRFMSIPVVREGKVRIVFGVGNKSSDYDDGDVEQLQVVANELHKIMAQRCVQDRLRHSEERFRHLVETTCDWIWELDAAGNFTYASPKVRDILGYAPEEVVGRAPFDFMPPGEAERIAAAFRELAGQRKAFSGLENVNLHKTGRQVVLETSGVPVLGESGELLGYRGMDRDVTERKRLASQLQQAQKLEAIGQLAGGVAHDFNNILAAILMQLGLLRMSSGADPEIALAVKELQTEARRAATLTRQLLMFSRRSVLEVKVLDLNEVTVNLLKMLGRLIGEDIKLVFEGCTGQLPSVLADAGMMEQILMNLVVNARDAMPKGGRVTLSTSVVHLGEAELQSNACRQPGCFVCLSVADTGVGMDKATLERIFEPFFTTKELGKGTGLGLATVHGIAAQHKGWVEVESELGVGSTFRVFLPAATEPVAREAQESPSEVLERGREAILVVEDEAAVRLGVAATLRGLGYRVYEAENGQQAMALWQKLRADVQLLLTDMVMPEGMTGLELAERLQAIKPGLKVIVSSGYSAEIVQAGGVKQAGVRYLPKPYEAALLAETVRICLDRET